jgi:hypothetical protein
MSDKECFAPILIHLLILRDSSKFSEINKDSSKFFEILRNPLTILRNSQHSHYIIQCYGATFSFVSRHQKLKLTRMSVIYTKQYLAVTHEFLSISMSAHELFRYGSSPRVIGFWKLYVALEEKLRTKNARTNLSVNFRFRTGLPPFACYSEPMPQGQWALRVI